ncbi:hypothetical protein TrLO_g7960 [Triparma laevis f. longispina]|uniref:Uncharacterized protein n=1 Tax=Triparma laevis f. longispina TaxID=1714387 RepID=A0A9W7FJ16_9STRA|nr:hypothetical protein TrLO_g7960 [Triparma laevis f. longispina]
MAKSLVLALGLALTDLSTAISIDEHGAIAGETGFEAAQANSLAIEDAFAAAQDSQDDRVVEIPAGSSYYIYSSTLANLTDVTFKIDGELIVHDTLEDWPDENGLYVFGFTDMNGLIITGNGKINGQGHDWWVAVAKTDIAHNYRPNMFEMLRVTDCVIENFTTMDSPHFNFHMKDMRNLEIRYMTITTDWRKQEEILKEHGLFDFDLNIPMFPFNTDGFDPAGENIYIHDCEIENYDDAVAVKPSSDKYNIQCTKNVTVENMKIRYGVGMSIGSVSANSHHDCVDDVVFRNIEFEKPFKAIYIKTNPGGEEGVDWGSISNIVYENITIESPVWYAIYIGPQQMKEPDGAGTGCMAYPFGGGDENCPTNPLVPIVNVTLKDVSISGGVTPGVVRCDEAAPCTGFVFDNVQYTSWASRLEGWICENAEGDEHMVQPKNCLA